jgi:hypothetical protein
MRDDAWTKPYKYYIWPQSMLLGACGDLFRNGLGAVDLVGTPPVGHPRSFDTEGWKQGWERFNFKYDAVEVIHNAHEFVWISPVGTVNIALREFGVSFAKLGFPEVIELAVNKRDFLRVHVTARRAEVSQQVQCQYATSPRRRNPWTSNGGDNLLI